MAEVSDHAVVEAEEGVKAAVRRGVHPPVAAFMPFAHQMGGVVHLPQVLRQEGELEGQPARLAGFQRESLHAGPHGEQPTEKRRPRWRASWQGVVPVQDAARVSQRVDVRRVNILGAAIADIVEPLQRRSKFRIPDR